MFPKSILIAAGALMCMAGSAQAQAVYQCGARSYSQLPCSNKMVDTREAPVPQNGSIMREHRARVAQASREECKRLTTRMPVDRERMKSPDPDEVASAEAALGQSARRAKQIGCRTATANAHSSTSAH